MGLLSNVGDLVKTVKELPFKRADGDLVQRIHPYRRMLSFMMPGRNEAICLYDDYARADALLDYVKRAREAFDTDVNITHCLVAAAYQALREVPSMNHFVVGKRLYLRKFQDVTFTMKRKKLDQKAKLGAGKLRYQEGESFEALCRRINEKINHERSGKKTYTDKELNVMTALPRPLLAGAMAAVRVLDSNNLLPGSFIDNDSFYTNMVIANLGSLGMDAAFHHLYEYGTCPLFLMVGKVEDRAVVVDGKVVPEKSIHLRWSYDERIDDGLTSFAGIKAFRAVLEDPDTWLGRIEAPARRKNSKKPTPVIAA